MMFIRSIHTKIYNFINIYKVARVSANGYFVYEWVLSARSEWVNHLAWVQMIFNIEISTEA